MASMTDKYVEDMDFNEFKDWACRYLFDSIIREGFKGLSGSMHIVLTSVLDNKVFGGKKK